MGNLVNTVHINLDKESHEVHGLDKYGSAVKDYVVRVLKDFCSQSEEFARAVADKPGKLKECINATIKGAGNYLSDNEVYKRAAEFYFPGAEVEFKMILHMSKYDKEELDKGGAISLDLDELLDFE